MKTTLLFLIALMFARAALAAAAFDTYIIQRNAANTANVQQTMTAPARGMMGWDASKAPISYAASVFGVAWLNTTPSANIQSLLAAADYAAFKALLSLDNVTNDVQTKAAIMPNTAPAAGRIPVGNAGGTAYVPVDVSGDVTLTSAGIATTAKINGIAVTGTPSTGYVLTATSSSAATWQAPSGGTVTVSGTPTSGQLTKWTSATNITAVTTGMNVETALGVNVGSAGAFVVNGGVLGTPSSGTGTNITGINLATGQVGATPIANGGTSLATLTANSIFIGNGTSTPIQLAPGTSGNVVTSNGTAWTSAAASAGTPSDVALTATLGSDNTKSSITLAGLNAGATIAQWEAVYLGSSSTWLLADANGSSTYPARGLAVAAYSSTNAAIVLREGVVRNDAWNWTPGGTIYLSGTAGAITQTAPSASGDKIQQVGFALTADIAYFNFASGEYLTVP